MFMVEIVSRRGFEKKGEGPGCEKKSITEYEGIIR
jgi:hypothetical protein